MIKIFSIIFLIISITLAAIFFFKPKPSSTLNPNDPFSSFPVYPNAQPSINKKEDKATDITYRWQKTWEVNQPVDIIMSWYLNHKQKSWKIITPPFDPSATGAQDAVFSFNNWQVTLIINQADLDQPTVIFAGLNPK